ncbi:MAG TPA: alpha-L-arabinofuranosidase C-terminal domain-containing protein [Tepidisphaeraceae bacterium]|nr:alpha-L-arabinofuranosidase C-terminal domain-containing protein [Tepidisphaeraceae bacterium]
MAEQLATIALDTDDVVADVPRTIFGGFAEHMGRCIYGGIYDPESGQADENGIRRDVAEALREMDLSVLRYPGGNFVSSYDWRDGVGPRDQRPRRRELAWQQIETNQFGTNEFIDCCRQMKIEPMLAVNLGTGGIMEAANLVEYCNAPVGTQYADLRASHGYPRPHGVKYWCLGNEMDGTWQVGQMTAEDYAKKAREAGKIMRLVDPSIQNIICGSSGPWMKTFPNWDRTALEWCWEFSHYLALHNYATAWEGTTTDFLAYSNEFERHIDTLATILRETKQKLGAKNDIYLSQDEWNVWYKDRDMAGRWRVAPPLCEETYNLEDALVVAQWLNVFIRKCDVLRMACLAQVVNTIAPLKTRGDELLRESTFYPFVMYSQHARGRSLRPSVRAATIASQRFGDVPQIDVSATVDAERNRAAVFIVHRAQAERLPIEITFTGPAAPIRVLQARQMWGLDPKAANTFDRPEVILPRDLAPMPVREGKLHLKLPPLSLTMLELQTP